MTTLTNKLDLQGISKVFDVPIFYDVDFCISAGKVASIVGSSGVGKSTLFNIVAGLIAPTKGKVLVDGKDITAKAGYVGYMLQKDLLLPFKTVYDNIALPLTLQRMNKRQIQATIAPYIDVFGLTGLTHKYPHLLSGGQRQRAALLRTYLSNDNLMLLDEPFSALDYVTKKEMYEWFIAFKKQMGLTCLIITHDIDEAVLLSDVIYVLNGKPATLSKPFFIDKNANFLTSNACLQLKERIFTQIKGKP